MQSTNSSTSYHVRGMWVLGLEPAYRILELRQEDRKEIVRREETGDWNTCCHSYVILFVKHV